MGKMLSYIPPKKPYGKPNLQSVTFLGSQPHHPDHQIVCQDAVLENAGICQEDTGADGAGNHLTLAPGELVFTGSSLAIQLMTAQRNMGKIRHIAEELILRHGKEHPFHLGGRQLSERHESTCVPPSMTLMQNYNGFDLCFFLSPVARMSDSADPIMKTLPNLRNEPSRSMYMLRVSKAAGIEASFRELTPRN